MQIRKGECIRETKETQIQLALNLDGGENRAIETGVGFFDHMLDLMAKQGFLDISLQCKGDVNVDAHHTVEDVGICMGKALTMALGDRKGIARYASCYLPMDETLVLAAVDISGRPFLHFNADIPMGAMVGGMEAQLAEEFFRALAMNAGITLHLNLLYGKNLHHILEAMFKAVGRAFADAAQQDPRVKGVPSTKGTLI